jgi:hypothetical protein
VLIICGGIVDPKQFDGEPELFIAGMLSALVGSTAWLLIATGLKLPVSTTHSIVGGILFYFAPSPLLLVLLCLPPPSRFPALPFLS